jgi:amino acid adenylation domain-containing protein
VPDAVALVWRDQEIGYAALVAQAERIRARIPVGDRAPVAVSMARGPLFVATLLAVLETGAPYLVLPRDWPVRRCREAMEQTGSRLCLIDGHGDAGPGDLAGLPDTAVIDPDGPSVPAADSAAPCDTGPRDGFAVIYTSGSTGTPKGVLSPHAGMFRLADDPVLAYDRTSRTLQAASVGWDGLSLELWAPLLRGGSCVLHDEDVLSPEAIRDAIGRGVNTLWLTASLFNTIIDTEPDCLTGLRLLMTGAERVSPLHMARCRALLPDVRLVNGYGPVEATSVFVSTYEIPAGLDGQRQVSVGTPLAGTTIHVVDENLRVTPRGRAGEIAVAGEGIALEYVRDTTATHRAFPVLPIGAGGAPVRVYRTGDLGRIELDGTLTFLGRLDRQVKIRGTRVDPIEVERVIEAASDVARAVVVPLPLDCDTKEYLAAFCVPAPGSVPSPERIRATVAHVLPRACVPKLVRPADHLPLTARGKVDVRRLVRDLIAEPESADARAEAEDPSEFVALVREYLNDLLGHRVGDHEDIFMSGASSLTAIRLSAKLRTRVGVTLSVAAIMRGRSPVGIAKELADAGTQAPEESV